VPLPYGTVVFGASFWDRNVIEPGKVPLLVLFVFFIATWLITRTITRSIRSGRGRLHDVSAGGLHLHHSVPGIVLLTAGAVAAVGLPATQSWRVVAAVAIGTGASLVFDEFAMILHLDDDYWKAEGRQSVEAVGLVAACLALGLVGFSPFGVDHATSREVRFRYATVAVMAATMAAVVVCAMKGKFRLALIAIFVWPVALVAAARLARPGSRWDARFYRDAAHKHDRATARAAAFDARWDPRWRHIADVLGGSPDATR
jgi:hypothetical protein